jgi:hypothetical protein
MAVRKFILVVEEDVVTDMTMPNVAKFKKHIDALSNNPRFFEVPIDSEISEGWIWDGNDFHPPTI